MQYRKNQIIKFKSREEKIIKGSSDPINGMVVTENETYSVDFLNRQLNFGFIKILKK